MSKWGAQESRTIPENNIINVDRSANVFSQYSVVTYNFRLFMIDPVNIKRDIDPRQATNQITIADSGASDRYYIQDVSIEHVSAPTRSVRNQTHRKFTLTIQEPRGVSLMDAIFGSAQQLNITNYFNIPYYLEVKFLGYDEDGVPRDLGYDKVWSIKILNMDQQITSEGTSYSIEAIGFNDIAFSDEVNITPRMFKVEASTVGEFFKNLARQWNQFEEDDFSSIVPDTYVFIPGDGIGSFRLNDNDVKFDPKSKDDTLSISSQSSGNKKIVQVSPGMDLSTIVESLLISNPEGVRELLEGDINNYLDSDYKKVNKKFWKIETDVRIKAYDPVRRKYAYTYKFYIKKYETMRPQINPETYANLNNREYQRRRLRHLNVEKIYEYIYSGENTEVLNLDISLNMAWVASLPIYHGYNTITHKDQGTQVEKSSKTWNQRVSDYKDVLSKFQLKKEELKSIDPSNPENAPIASELYEAREASREELLNIRQGDSDQPTLRNASKNYIESSNVGRNNYASEFIGKSKKLPSEDTIEPLPVSLVVSGNRVETDYRNMFEGTQKEYPSVASTVLNQIYFRASKDLFRIELEIRGDPWWLALSNIEEAKVLEEGVEQNPSLERFSQTFNRDNLIILKFKIPRDFDPETGFVNFQSSDIVTGVYQVFHITNSFQNGQFTQTLDCIRDPATNIAVIDNGDINE